MFNSLRSEGRLIVPLVAAALVGWEPVLAGPLEEVVVTAQKREQSAQQIGISISSLDGETMRNFNIQESSDISNRIPNVENGSFGPGWNAQVAIRGIATDDFNDLSESPVAMYLDDVYLVPLGAGNFPTFDLERVEVLRGPQGTLFGRNTTGGILHFQSARPTQKRTASAELTLADHDEYIVKSHLNIPLADDVASRVAFYRRANNGWVDNITTGGEDGEADVWGTRAGLLYDPTDDLSLLLTYQYNLSDGSTQAFNNVPTYPDERGFVHELPANQNFWGTPGVCPDQCPPASLGTLLGFFPFAGPGTDQLGTPNQRSLPGDVTTMGQFNNAEARSHLAVLNADWQIGDLQLTSITAGNYFTRDTQIDCDGGPIAFCSVSFGFTSKQVSEELRIFLETANARWTTGVYFLYQDGDVDYYTHQDSTGAVLGIGPGFPVDLVFGAMQYLPGTYPGGVSFDVTQDQDLYSISGFGHVEYDLTPTMTAVIGARLGYDQKDTGMQIRMYIPGNSPATYPSTGQPNNNVPAGPNAILNLFDFTDANPLVGGLNTIEDVSITIKGELDWRPNDDWLVYGSINRGVKAASFNNGFVIPSTIQDVPVDEEILVAYEIGVKSSLFDNRARLNISAFYYDYNDFQGVQFVSFGSFIANHDASIMGLETELEAQVTDRLFLSLGVGLLHSEVEDVMPVQDLTQPQFRGITYDREMPFAPSWSINGMARYEWPSFIGGTMAIQADFFAKDSYHVEIVNNPADDVPSYVVGNARIQYIDPSERIELTFFVNNVADNIYVSRNFDITNSGGMIYRMYAPGRWIGGSIRANFDF